jgi:hypothetical protein
LPEFNTSMKRFTAVVVAAVGVGKGSGEGKSALVHYMQWDESKCKGGKDSGCFRITTDIRCCCFGGGVVMFSRHFTCETRMSWRVCSLATKIQGKNNLPRAQHESPHKESDTTVGTPHASCRYDTCHRWRIYPTMQSDRYQIARPREAWKCLNGGHIRI